MNTENEPNRRISKVDKLPQKDIMNIDDSLLDEDEKFIKKIVNEPERRIFKINK